MPFFRLPRQPVFPHPDLAEPDGLLAAGGDLSEARLLHAYRQGIFPWYSRGEPILWWSPDPRMVLFPEELHLSRRMQRVIRSETFQARTDTAFAEVIEACAHIPRRKERGTWIVRDMQKAYTALHQAGWAHSVEAWQDGLLAGGLYGVSTGRAFFGESMFSRCSNASKFALYALVQICLGRGIRFIDCQFHTEHLARCGAREISRGEYLQRLEESQREEALPGLWTGLPEEPATKRKNGI